MHALDADSHNVRARPVDAPVLPRASCLVALQWSNDQGKTWQESGALNLPTSRYDSAARLFLMTAMTMAAEDHATNVVWQAHAWAVHEGEVPAPGAAPVVSLRSDGEPS
ncbi:MAG TPA: hypothetical protein VM347_35970 [Nonomuraea sp.]|nr:hypothetical protein [Nonomuraea sp.]